MKRLEEQVVEQLQLLEYHIATAESCTGGLIAATIVNVAGASAVFDEGFITYANHAKAELLGVSEADLKEYGAVSEQVARQMALGCAKKAGAQVGIASTGIAGPDGGTAEKPVGLVYLACAVNGQVTVTRNQFSGNRSEIRNAAVNQALELVQKSLNR